jgi:hypothetical protein
LLAEANPVELDVVALDLVAADAEATIVLGFGVGTAEVFFMYPSLRSISDTFAHDA